MLCRPQHLLVVSAPLKRAIKDQSFTHGHSLTNTTTNCSCQMSPTSDGLITEAELMTITAADFPTPAELDADMQLNGGGNIC